MCFEQACAAPGWVLEEQRALSLHWRRGAVAPVEIGGRLPAVRGAEDVELIAAAERTRVLSRRQKACLDSSVPLAAGYGMRRSHRIVVGG